MTETEFKRELANILNDLIEEIDVPPSKYKDAIERYEAVGKWLNEKDSPLLQYNPTIYSQGSFALGTVVRPLEDEDYDVDAVCLLQIKKDKINQKLLKSIVGDRLKNNMSYMRMLEPEGRRCWTLKYSDESRFHLDILPAIPDEDWWVNTATVPQELAKYAICITDRGNWGTNSEWPKSNPKGYLEWFKNRMRVIFESRKSTFALEKKAEIQKIPDYEIRTPLQRVIQLLKRHRDVRLNGDEDKPISIIITTLAAQAYNNEADLVDALLNIVPKMRQAIENRQGVLWVPNPVNPQENYAEKWAEKPRKAEMFFEWLQTVEREHRELLTRDGFQKVGHYLAESYGERDASAAMTKYASRTGVTGARSTIPGISIPEIGKSRLPSRFDVPQRELPKWRMDIQNEVRISAIASKEGYRSFRFNSDSRQLEKHFSLRFEAITNALEPYDVFWQVVNTGAEATSIGKNGLRGGIFLGSLIQKESTLYHGMHWIECFIVKGSRCVARSGEFVVNIK